MDTKEFLISTGFPEEKLYENNQGHILYADDYYVTTLDLNSKNDIHIMYHTGGRWHIAGTVKNYQEFKTLTLY